MKKIGNYLASGLVVFVSVMLCLFVARASANPDMNLAVVDVAPLQQQFLTEINDQLTQEFQSQKSELQSSLDAFRTEYEAFMKNSTTMSEDQKKQRSNELGEKQNALQVKVQEFDQKIAVRKQEELQKKLQTLFTVVQQISSEAKYDMVLAKTAALYVSDKYDITQKVVSGYKTEVERLVKEKEAKAKTK